MSMQEYEKAVRIMSKYSEMQNFVGPRSETLIEKAEWALDLTFPTTYRRFLSEFGAGNFGSVEFYGVIDENFSDGKVPDGIWYTLAKRKDFGFPHEMVIIYNDGMGYDFAIDLRSGVASDAPIVAYPIGYSLDQVHQLELIAGDFGEFFLSEIENEIEYASKNSQ